MSMHGDCTVNVRGNLIRFYSTQSICVVLGDKSSQVISVHIHFKLLTRFISDAPEGVGEIEPNVAKTAVYTQRLPVYFHCFLVLVLTH